MLRLFDLCGFALAALLGASNAAAQQKASPASHRPGRILGVFDEESGAPIPDAEVTDLFADGVARTESHGLVELSQFASRNDSAAVRIRKVGFSDTAFVIMVSAADTQTKALPAPVGRAFRCSNYSPNGVPNSSRLTIQQVLRENADEFVGVEYYNHRGQVPTQFHASCIIILWTRHS